MKSQASRAMEKGLTPQLMKRVTPTPRQCSVTPLSAFRSIFKQHRDDHQPDEHRHRQVDLRDLDRSHRMECPRRQVPQADADQDADEDPNGEIAVEHPHRRAAGPFTRGFALRAHDVLLVAAGDDPEELFEELRREANLVFGHYNLEYELGLFTKTKDPE
jgi:hypothetical protein